MKTRALGKSGIEASVVAFGAWAIGGWKWGGTDAAKAVDAVRSALDHGVTMIDTAAIYGFGLSEKLVGEAIKDRPRDEIVIATKCGLRWDLDGSGGEMLHGSASPEQPIHRSNRPESIKWECEQSLQRLGIDHIDLYMTHWQDPNVPGDEVMGAMQDLKAAGKIRAVGTCNATLEELSAYDSVAPLDADQELWNALERGKTPSVEDARTNGRAFLAYSPMAQGLLTGKIGPARVFPEDDIRHGNPKFSAENRARVAAFLENVAPIADTHDANLEHVMLAWTLQQGVTHVLVGARDADQAAMNAKAGQIALADDELAEISRAVQAFGSLV